MARIKTTTRWFPLLASLLGVWAVLCPAQSPAPANKYMWTDKNGERHYGDAVPADASQNDTRILNNQGIEVQHQGAGKDAQQQAEQNRREQELAQRQQHDHFLLATYAGTKDIERLRDERIEQMDSQIHAASSYVDTLDARLKGLQDRALTFRPYSSSVNARIMPDAVAEDLVHAARENHSQHAALDGRIVAERAARDQFNADIARYKELTTHHDPG
jgi:hypothetical protein